MSAAAVAVLYEPSLLEVLTDRIVAGELSVDEARLIVKRSQYYKQHPVGLPIAKNVEELEEMEARMIARAVNSADGNVSEAARAIGVNKTTIHRKLKEMRFWI